jgi:hypothetical protein
LLFFGSKPLHGFFGDVVDLKLKLAETLRDVKGVCVDLLEGVRDWLRPQLVVENDMA